MTAQQINTKIELCEAAIDLYLADKFSIPNLVDKTDKTASEIYLLFPDKKSILEFYYPSLVLRYRAMIAEIPDFESYSIGEKMSNFIFTLFDLMEEQQDFVKQTFYELEYSLFAGSEFHKEVKFLFKDFFRTDSKISLSASFLIGDYFYAFLRNNYLRLVRFWLNDNSDEKERTLALTDKFTSFIEEVVYSKVADKGLDLFKFTISSSGLTSKIPGMDAWMSQWFGEEKEEQDHE